MNDFVINEIVYDDLTGRAVKILGFESAESIDRGDKPNVKRAASYFLIIDNPEYFEGLRWPWEVTKYRSAS